MRHLRLICLLLALSVVFAHSISPHHHHTDEIIKVAAVDHHHDAHHHDSEHHDQSAEGENHHHNTFTFVQIDETFLTAKYFFGSLNITPILIRFEWSLFSYISKEPKDFFVKDIDLPPLIRWCTISFRGPPSL